MKNGSAYHSIDKIAVVYRNNTLRTHSHRNVVVESLGQLLLNRKDILLIQVGTNQTNSAVDIITHTAYRLEADLNYYLERQLRWDRSYRKRRYYQ